MFNTEVTKCYSLITLLRYYGKVSTFFFFLITLYGITASYFTLLSYWHQSYCKSKCFILITLLHYYGKVLHSSYWHQSYCKHKCFFRITLLPYYGKVLRPSFLLASKLL